jgi:predicted DNA-binding protein
MTKQNTTVVTSIRLSSADHEALKALAKREARTVSGQLSYLIRALADEQREEAA